MSTYTDQIDNHDIHTSIENINIEIDTIEKIENKAPLAVETLARIAFIVKNLDISLGNCNKDLISITWLNDATKALKNISSYLNNFKNNNDSNSLMNNCNSQLDIILQCTAKMNCIRSNQKLRNIVEAENEYKKIMDFNNQQLYNKVMDIESKLELLKIKISENEDKAQNNLSSLQQIIDSEKKRLDSFGISYQSQMAEDKKSSIALSDQFKTDFNRLEDEREKQFEEEIEKIVTERNNQQTQWNNQTIEIRKNSENLIEVFKQKFADYEKQVKNIVGVVNTNMFSHRYKEVADNAKFRANVWHVITVFLMICVSAFAIFSFVITENTDTNWIKLVAKIFATTTLVTGAAYSARQASKQEKVERYARKIEMELVAIDPFISTLNEEKQGHIKEELSKKLFGNVETMEFKSKDEPYIPMDKLTSIENLLSTLVKIFSK